MRVFWLFWASALCPISCEASTLPPSGEPSYQYVNSAEYRLATQQDGSLSRPNDDLSNQQRADAVKDAFTFAFNSYWEYCKGQDELLPVTNTCGNPR